MKLLLKTSFCITSLFLLLSSCSDDEVTVKDKLIGTWNVEKTDSIKQFSGQVEVYKTTFELSLTAQDSAFLTYFRYISNQKEYYDTDSSTYSISNNGNVIEFTTKQATQNIEFPFIFLVQTYTIQTIDDQNLIFKSENEIIFNNTTTKTTWKLVKI